MLRKILPAFRLISYPREQIFDKGLVPTRSSKDLRERSVLRGREGGVEKLCLGGNRISCSQLIMYLSLPG